jgi:hypothetical protein
MCSPISYAEVRFHFHDATRHAGAAVQVTNQDLAEKGFGERCRIPTEEPTREALLRRLRLRLRLRLRVLWVARHFGDGFLASSTLSAARA